MASEEYDIVGLGVSTLDLLTVVDEFPGREGVQLAHESSLQGGGPIATALVAASKLGAMTAMIDTLGSDWRGKIILDEFMYFGVDTRYIKVLEKRTSSIASINVRKRDGKRAIVYSPGSVPDFPPEDLPNDVLKKAKIIHVNGRHWDACKIVCHMAKDNCVKVSFDGGAGRYRQELDEILSIVDYCIISKEFCEEWIGKMDVEELAKRLIDNGPELAVITMGEAGSFACGRNGESIFQKAYNIDRVVDTTGCGDVYHGAFLFCQARGYRLDEAIKIASAAAALKATQLGGRGIIPDINEVREFILTHQQ